MEKTSKSDTENMILEFCTQYGLDVSMVNKIVKNFSSLQRTEMKLEGLAETREKKERVLWENMRATVDNILNKCSIHWGDCAWKFGVRSCEEKNIRGVLTHRLNKRREELVIKAIQEQIVTWHVGVSNKVSEYGRGFDERVIELPIAVELAGFDAGGKVLDAGCGLNLEYLRSYIENGSALVTHVTQSGASEPCCFKGNKISYQFSDLRDLPYLDETFDRVMCVSTLEHVGMDNQRYGADAEYDRGAYKQALIEMYRVLRSGGILFVSVPYGISQDRGWYQVFGQKDVEAMRKLLPNAALEVRYFVYDHGWQNCGVSDPRLSNGDAACPEMVRGVVVLKYVKPALVKRIWKALFLKSGKKLVGSNGTKLR